MSKLTKNQKIAEAKVEAGRHYKLDEACALVKDCAFTKFDSSVEIAVRLGVDPRKANQMVRGVVTLPNGTGKQVRVLVLCTPDKEAEAKEAGADFVGLDEYIEKMLVDLLPFYEALCSDFFDEDIEATKWNYDDYFTQKVRQAIKEVTNPLDA